jgi:hypothetical protein
MIEPYQALGLLGGQLLELPFARPRVVAAGSLDSHLGGARTLILPGRIGLATRESA